MRILIVEDENALRTSLVAQFTEAGFNVDNAADGEEGLYFGREYPLDLAIIDLGLPKLSGLELIKKLRADGKTYPILILTARDQWQDKVEGLESGADDYVAKPFHFPEVSALLLRRSAGWAQAVLQGGPVVPTHAPSKSLSKVAMSISPASNIAYWSI
jgi:two-component system response regulator PhoP